MSDGYIKPCLHVNIMKNLLKELNPWWVTGHVDTRRTGISRDERLSEIMPLLAAKEVIVLSGVRRSGKSTLLHQIIAKLLETVAPVNILFFSCDEPLKEPIPNLVEAVLDTFIELHNPGGKKYVLIDEIQLVDGWEQWIKKYYDRFGAEIKFIVTGSNVLMLPSKSSVLLSGRVFHQGIFPLTFREYLAFNGITVQDVQLQMHELKHHFMLYMPGGGFPEVVLDKNPQINKQRLREYYNSIVLRDIIAHNEVRDVNRLVNLVALIMANVGTLFSYNKVARSLGSSNHVIKEYMSYLENAYLIFTVGFFSYSLKDTITIQKPVKIYCIDNGMREAIAYKVFQDESPKLAENLVFLTIKWAGKACYYWKGTQEVDFIVRNDDGTLTAINVSYTDRIPDREFKGFAELEALHPRVREKLLISETVERMEGDIRIVPLWKWLLVYHEYI